MYTCRFKFQKFYIQFMSKGTPDNGSVVCLTTKGRQLEQNFEELKPASHVPILGTILNIFDVFVAVFFSLLLSRTTVDSNFFHGPIEFEITRVN
jgi:hypothetical protein